MTDGVLPREPFSHFTADRRPKLALPNRREARAAGRRMFSRYGDKVAAYRCATCQQWHLTTSLRRSSD